MAHEPEAAFDRRVARALVALYPPAFREAVGADLADAIVDRMRGRRASGASAARATAAAAVDALSNAALEWLCAVPRIFAGGGGVDTEPSDGGRTVRDTLMQDVRYALRLWRRRPGFAAVAIATLALGIGANTAMFSIVNAVLLRPLPYADADRLAAIWARTPTTPRALLSYDEYVALRAQRGTFDEVALWLGQSVNLTGVAEPQRILGSFVTGSFFQVLHLRAERGRLFDEPDSAPGSAKPVVVLSELFWERQFNRDPDIVGKAITINGTPLVVVGVLALPYDRAGAGVDGWLGYDAFLPAGLFPAPAGVPRATLNATPWLVGLGRLAHGAAFETANAGLDVVSRRLEAANPQVQRGRTMFVLPAHEDLVGEARTPLLLLLASVGCVLLIACLNISNLLLTRAVDRQREIAVRAALGASRTAVARQLAIEASLLAVVSASVGLLLGRWSLQAIVAWRPASVSLPDAMPLDSRVLLFTLAATAVCALACGLAPALRAARSDLVGGLQGRRTTGVGRVVRDGFVVAEIALSAVLIAMSALLIQSLWALQRVNVGFEPGHVFTLQLRLPAAKYRTPDDITRFFEQAIARIRAVPGVESAAFVRRVPLSGNWGETTFVPEGRVFAKGAEPRASQNLVTPDYFRTMRIPIEAGRDFSDRDALTAPPVVIVNETLARTIWPGENPIGRRVTVPDFTTPATVVGVVADVKHRAPTEPAQPQLYVPHYQSPQIFCSLVARTVVPPLTLTSDIRRAVWSVDKDQPMWAINSVETIVDGSRGPARFLASLLGIFAGVALLLAAVGIYGVTSYGVAQRTREIGIRLALGASGRRVLYEVVGRGAKLTVVALAIGLVAAAGLARLAAALLYGVKPTDPVTLAGAAAVLAFVSLAATYLPARRASRVDPVVALADE